MTPERLMTKSLWSSPYGERIARIISTALDAANPAKAVKSHMHRADAHLPVGFIELDRVGAFWHWVERRCPAATQSYRF